MAPNIDSNSTLDNSQISAASAKVGKSNASQQRAARARRVIQMIDSAKKDDAKQNIENMSFQSGASSNSRSSSASADSRGTRGSRGSKGCRSSLLSSRQKKEMIALKAYEEECMKLFMERSKEHAERAKVVMPSDEPIAISVSDGRTICSLQPSGLISL